MKQLNEYKSKTEIRAELDDLYKKIKVIDRHLNAEEHMLLLKKICDLTLLAVRASIKK